MIRTGNYVFCWVVAVLVLGVSACNYERMKEQPSILPYEQQLIPAVPAAVPIDGGENRYRLSPPGSLNNPVAPTRDSIDRGFRCYEYFCIQCHGSDYSGDGTVGQSFAPLPSDLGSPDVQDLTDDDLFRSISYGMGRHPPLADTVAVEDRWHLINWIRSLGAAGGEKEPAPSGDFLRSVQGLP